MDAHDENCEFWLLSEKPLSQPFDAIPVRKEDLPG
jgi:hypothetical protein